MHIRSLKRETNGSTNQRNVINFLKHVVSINEEVGRIYVCFRYLFDRNLDEKNSVYLYTVSYTG